MDQFSKKFHARLVNADDVFSLELCFASLMSELSADAIENNNSAAVFNELWGWYCGGTEDGVWQYFNEYENVFAAFSGGKIVSFCIAESGCLTMLSRDGENVGSVGCVGTIPAARGQGTGLAMVGKASEQLISRGCDVIYIHYTHLGKWYGKLDFEPFIYFGFGRKAL